MSRLTLSCSLVIALSSVAVADRATGFAKPPTVASVTASSSTASGVAEVPQLRIAPRRWLDRDTVRAALISARAANLNRFRVYQRKGVFPSNTYTDGKLNVWLDEDGHFCAAATIIKMSGKDALVNQVAEQNNFIRLADVRQGPLMNWILTSGFTQDEIAAIQEPFMPVTDNPVPEPQQPILVDSQLRRAEDARLRAKYRVVDRMLVKNQSRSIELAVDRLMKHQDLAWQLVASTPS